MLGTANKLKNARNISLTGAVSGSGNFDGSGNLNINTTQNNIAVLTGSVVAKKSSDPGNSFQQTRKSITYPSGFNNTNCVCMALGVTRINNAFEYDGSEGCASKSVGYVSGNIPRAICLDTSNIDLRVYNYASGDITIYYKIVLMKVS